jgi:GntR family transcriptional regulator
MAQQPRYLEIADALRKQIEDEKFPKGTRLPTEIELGGTYKASRNTVRDAIKRLMSEGLIETRPGKGTFVTLSIRPFVTPLTDDPKTGLGGGEGGTYLNAVVASHRVPKNSSPKVEMQMRSDFVTRLLELQPGSQLVLRHEERYIDDIPWSLQTSFYPMEFIQRGAIRLLMAENIAEGTVSYLADAINVRQSGYRDWITARLPDQVEQDFFSVDHDATVFEIFRTAFDQNKNPMRLTVTVYPADRNQFIVDVGDDLPDAPALSEDEDPSAPPEHQ